MNDMRDYGYRCDAPCPEGLLPGRVTEVRRALYGVVCAYGEIYARLTGSFMHETAGDGALPAVGDFVLIRRNENGPSGITRLLPRVSTFSRTDFSGHKAGYVKTVLEQVVAANFDYVLIMSALDGDFNPSRIARYLTAARRSGGQPIVALTKADLHTDHSAYVDETERMAGGAPVIALSSLTGAGLDTLEAYLRPGVTAVLLGMSGVGKSSLLNALAGRELMATAAVRQADSRGRHTTTHRQLILLPSGAMLIDTPGMRELGLWDADEGISASFPEAEALISQCAFADCSHLTEPGCAIRAALDSGELTLDRWNQYLKQKKEAAFVARRGKRR